MVNDVVGSLDRAGTRTTSMGDGPALAGEREVKR